MSEADLMKQRNEAIAELVKALLIINGGGAVALLAFLQSAWVQEKALVVPVAYAVSVLGFGSLLAAACHLLRYHASWYHHKWEDSALGMVQALLPAYCVGFTIRIRWWRSGRRCKCCVCDVAPVNLREQTSMLLRFPSSQCASAIQIVRSLESIAET